MSVLYGLSDAQMAMTAITKTLLKSTNTIQLTANPIHLIA